MYWKYRQKSIIELIHTCTNKVFIRTSLSESPVNSTVSYYRSHSFRYNENPVSGARRAEKYGQSVPNGNVRKEGRWCHGAQGRTASDPSNFPRLIFLVLARRGGISGQSRSVLGPVEFASSRAGITTPVGGTREIDKETQLRGSGERRARPMVIIRRHKAARNLPRICMRMALKDVPHNSCRVIFVYFLSPPSTRQFSGDLSSRAPLLVLASPRKKIQTHCVDCTRPAEDNVSGNTTSPVIDHPIVDRYFAMRLVRIGKTNKRVRSILSADSIETRRKSIETVSGYHVG